MNINKNNYLEIFYALQEELNESDLELEDWIFTEFTFYLFDNKFECKDESLFELYEKVRHKIFLNEIREEKLNKILK